MKPGGRVRGPAGPARVRDGVPDPVPVVYIAGIGRSGSTLLARALGRLPGWFSAGELMHLFGRGMDRGERCACGTPVPECPVWSRVVDRLLEEGLPDAPRTIDAFRHRMTEGRGLLRPFLGPKSRRLRTDLAAYRGLMGRVYRTVRASTGCRVVVDSSKSVSQARILLGAPDIRLHLVHLVRDSRGVVHSLGKEVRRPGTRERRAILDRRPPLAGALLWSAANLLAERLAPEAASYRRVRYARFVADPARVLARIAGDVEEEPPPPRELPVDGRFLELDADHILSGNPVRAERGRVELREDLEWQEAMPRLTRRLVALFTAPLLRRYGLDGRGTRVEAPDGV